MTVVGWGLLDGSGAGSCPSALAEPPSSAQSVAGRKETRRHSPRLGGFDLSRSLIPPNEIRHGGPGKDGIPSLTAPRFLLPDQATYLKPKDRVIGVRIGKQARAYPLRILDWHEAVNDRVEGVPLLVTYCPLCDSAAVFDRRTPSGEREFGISGLLYNSNVLLYDRDPSGRESLWSQMMAQAVSGEKAGQRLKVLPCELTTWDDWKARHPQTLVLSTETGFRRVYSASPYAMYFRHNRLMFPARPIDKRLPLKTPVLGIWVGSKARAYPVSAFSAEQKVLRLRQKLGGASFIVLYDPASRSLRVERADPNVRWMYAFWFAWYAFYPDTELFGDGTDKPDAHRSR
ncbi:MAG: DUF3179 domain-containing protein [Planctomycetes bacterium]|nr:DUF3179 domain-containing protein [Planctomycetota bacterium]